MAWSAYRNAPIGAATIMAAAFLLAQPAAATCDRRQGNAIAEVDCKSGWNGNGQYYERAPRYRGVNRGETWHMDDGRILNRRAGVRYRSGSDGIASHLDGDRAVSRPGGGYGGGRGYRSGNGSRYSYSYGNGGRGVIRRSYRPRTSLGTMTGKEPWWVRGNSGLGSGTGGRRRPAIGSDYSLGTRRGNRRLYRGDTDYGLGRKQGNPYHYDGSRNYSLGTVRRSPGWDRRRSLGRGTFRPY